MGDLRQGHISRRRFLKHALLGVAGATLLDFRVGLADAPYGPFKVGVQSFSLRNFDRAKMLQLTAQMGLRYLEAYRKHIPITTDQAQIRALLAELKQANIKLISFGVVGFGKNAQQNRAAFEFAKAMGIETLTANPRQESLNQLDELVDEFQINIAIHNHGPRALYDKIEDTLKAMEGRNKRIGACVDTGHYMRSNEDPLEAIKAFGDRIYGVHLKDLDENNKFAELGKGKLDLEGCLRALAAQKMSGCLAIEYEEHPENPVPYIEQYLAVLRETIAKLKL